MKKVYQKPNLETVNFQFKEHIAASGGPTPVCYPIYTNIDTDENLICDSGTPVYQGKTN